MKKALLSAIFTVLALATSNAQTLAADSREAHVGLPQDWSSRHLLHPGPVVGAPVNGQFRDPRVIYGQLQQLHNLEGRQLSVRRNLSAKTAPGSMHRDWSFTLGPGGGMADGMSPAKYSFDINAIPSCANDFLIYTVASAGASNTPNIVGFNNLYSGTSAALTVAAGTAGASESVNTVTITTTAAHGLVVGQQVTISGVTVAGYNGTFTILTTPSTTTFTYTDASSGLANSGGGTATPLGICGATPSMKWAYNASNASGSMNTSPVLSFNGTQVGFVEGVSGGPSVFHALTLDSAGAGSFNTGTNVYTAATPGTITSLTLTGSKNVTLSSPWVDYGTNTAYVGDDNGTLYRISCVFGCTSSTLDWSFSVSSGKILTGPVWDQTSQAIFVGASDGKLYRLTGCAAGNTPVCTSANIAIGDGTTTNSSSVLVGGVNDPVLLDSTFQVVYASSANSSGGQLVETGTGVGTAKTFTTALATISNGSSLYVVHSPAFSDAYFSNVSGTTVTPTGTILGCAANNSKAAFLYSSPFSNANSATNTPLSPANPPIVGASAQSNPPGNANAGCSPVTEFNNGSDRIFFSQPLSVSNKCGAGSSGFTGGCIFENALTSGSPGTTYGAFMVTGGTSGIIIDNVSVSPQASSIYFGDLGSNTCSNAGTSSSGHCAVKLTQSSLQ